MRVGWGVVRFVASFFVSFPSPFRLVEVPRDMVSIVRYDIVIVRLLMFLVVDFFVGDLERTCPELKSKT